MTSLRVAAVQASYVLMDRAATLDRVAELTAAAAAQGAQLVAFPIRGEEIARECPGTHARTAMASQEVSGGATLL
jgi:hypothetical protein